MGANTLVSVRTGQVTVSARNGALVWWYMVQRVRSRFSFFSLGFDIFKITCSLPPFFFFLDWLGEKKPMLGLALFFARLSSFPLSVIEISLQPSDEMPRGARKPFVCYLWLVLWYDVKPFSGVGSRFNSANEHMILSLADSFLTFPRLISLILTAGTTFFSSPIYLVRLSYTASRFYT